MPADNDPKSGPAAEPFRKPATWGRPPQTVFRAGPLPKGERLAPLPELPAMSTPRAAPPPRPAQPTGARPDIFSGSMIPRPAYKPTPPLPTQVEPLAGAGEGTRPQSPAPAEPRIATTPPATSPLPTDAAPGPDLVVRPLPEPVSPAPSRPAEPLIPLTAAPVAQPAPSATAPVIETVAPRVRQVRKPNRMPLMVGGAVAALAAVAVGVWWINRAPVAPDAIETVPSASETPSAPTLPTVFVSGSPATDVPVASAPATATPPVNRPISPRPDRTSPRDTATPPPATRPAQATPTPTPAPTPAPTVQAPPIVVQIAPTTPPPTTAVSPTSDPDAPVVTRPQPLN